MVKMEYETKVLKLSNKINRHDSDIKKIVTKYFEVIPKAAH